MLACPSVTRVINSTKRRRAQTHESLIINAHTQTQQQEFAGVSSFKPLALLVFGGAEYTHTHTLLDKFQLTLSFRLTLHFDFVYLRLSRTESNEQDSFFVCVCICLPFNYTPKNSAATEMNWILSLFFFCVASVGWLLSFGSNLCAFYESVRHGAHGDRFHCGVAVQSK